MPAEVTSISNLFSKTKYSNFVKAHGCGNDFIIMNNFDNSLHHLNYSKVAIDVCRRNYSVGADGLVIIDNSEIADYYMHIYDADGTRQDMCGNASRCAALYASKVGLGSELTFETGAGILEASVKENSVKVKMTQPNDFNPNIKLKVDDQEIKLHYINTGIPHVVVFTDEQEIEVSFDLGKKIRNHEMFEYVGGVSVNFVNGISENQVNIQTYEVGVEDITQACGTGSTAAGLVLGLIKGLDSPVILNTVGGDQIIISFAKCNNFVENVYMEGPAELMYAGRI